MRLEPIDCISVDFGSASRCTLWLLVAPAVLLCSGAGSVVRRRSDTRRYRAARLVPVRERFGVAGELAFWFFAIAALALTILALARPQGITSIVRSPGADIVLLMDGSTSMRVRDMGTDRWQRAMQWVRTLTKTLLERRSRGARHVRGHRGPANPADARPEHDSVLPRSSRQGAHVQAGGRHEPGTPTSRTRFTGA